MEIIGKYGIIVFVLSCLFLQSGQRFRINTRKNDVRTKTVYSHQ